MQSLMQFVELSGRKITKENELIEQLLEKLGDTIEGQEIEIGPGDDAAVITFKPDEEIVVTVDTAIEGTHFPHGCPGELVGYRSAIASISDVIAMGAKPHFLIIAHIIEDNEDEWLKSFADGLRAACHAANLRVIGGNLARGPHSVTITAIGSVPKGKAMVRGPTALSNDIWLTGKIGASVLALAEEKWDFQPLSEMFKNRDSNPTSRFFTPPIHTDFAIAVREHATTMTDVSDGLVVELEDMIKGSLVGININVDQLPIWNGADIDKAIGQDDNYELLFSIGKSFRGWVKAIAEATHTQVTRIGKVTCEPGTTFLLDNQVFKPSSGYSHF